MSKPTLADLPPRYQEQIRAQLARTPKPRTVAIEPAHEPQKRTNARAKADSLRFARFLRALSLAGITAPQTELKFHSSRRWRFDFAWPDSRLAVECEGGVWSGGRHTRGAGFIGDLEKYNRATELGWRVLRYTPEQLTKPETIAQISALIK
jgi:very-short-patch-repair endonuclease